MGQADSAARGHVTAASHDGQLGSLDDTYPYWDVCSTGQTAR